MEVTADAFSIHEERARRSFSILVRSLHYRGSFGARTLAAVSFQLKRSTYYYGRDRKALVAISDGF